MLAYLAFVTLTLLSVRDIDFFSLESRTTLPIANIAIPTTIFFWTAAWLGAAFHAFLHLYLLKLWDPLAEAPARVGGRPLGEAIHPWLVCDWALRRRPDRADAITPRPMAWLADLVALVMVWLAAPLVLAAFWLRSMPAHDEGLTLTIAGALLLSLYASRKGWRRATARLRDPGAPALEARGLAAWPGRLGFAAVALLLAAVSWARTEGGFEHYSQLWSNLRQPEEQRANENDEAREARWIQAQDSAPWRTSDYAALLRHFGICVQRDDTRKLGSHLLTVTSTELWDAIKASSQLKLNTLAGENTRTLCDWLGINADRFTPLAAVDLMDADLADHPADWLNRDTAERRFRIVWCRDRDIPPDACHAPQENDLGNNDDAFAAARALHARAQATWCAAEGRALDAKACHAHFAGLDRGFGEEWREQRDGALANLAKPAMHGRDLRGAQAQGAFLAGLDLRSARMQGADFRGARMEGADFRGARVEGADFRGARMEDANLRAVWMDGANLSGARLAGAVLYEARMEGAVLRMARMDGANLSLARMEGADLSGARMEGANLSGARIEGANLSGARMEGADLAGARMEGTDLSGAQFQSAEWANVIIGPSLAHSADFTGGRNLTQAQLDVVIGNDDTVLPHGLHVWSCWDTPPPNLDAMIHPLDLLKDPDASRARWLCSPDNPRRKVGRPAPE